jgi:hypothetical protein
MRWTLTPGRSEILHSAAKEWTGHVPVRYRFKSGRARVARATRPVN